MNVELESFNPQNCRIKAAVNFRQITSLTNRSTFGVKSKTQSLNESNNKTKISDSI